MEFLKELFTEPLSYEAFSKAVKEKGIKLADLAKGEYVTRDKLNNANEALKTANETITTLKTEAEKLKNSGADAEEWKNKFEALQKNIAENEKKAKAEREAKEKADNIANRFNTVIGEKKFSHEAIREAYLKKFGEALESEDFTGKSDTDIIYALTKDDAAAFEGVESIRLQGGTSKSINEAKKYSSKADIMQIKDAGERQKAIAENLELFE